MSENPEILRYIDLSVNQFLHRQTRCYFVLDYLRYGTPGNPDFILTLKNTFNSEPNFKLERAQARVEQILTGWLPVVMQEENLSPCSIVCVPRAKGFYTYSNRQMCLLQGVHQATNTLAQSMNVTDATRAVFRTVNTKTTHFRKPVNRVTVNQEEEPNNGPEPYPGITKGTCNIDVKKISGKNILLVDDIYTYGVNVDEDCIQALYDAGASKVVLFTLSRTVPKG